MDFARYSIKNPVNIWLMVVIFVTCAMNINAKLMYIIFSKKLNMDNLSQEDISKSQHLVDIQKYSF